MKILVPDSLSSAALDVFNAEEGWEVIQSTPQEFTQHLGGADALVVRSATKVTRDVLEQAGRLKVIGRAGVGVDNVDIEAATARGVVVMNTPGGNAISVAEHTLALMLALARKVAQADVSMKSGKWEKKRFLGNELNGKTLGIVGFGNIGMQVAARARPFAMTVITHDPFVSREVAKDHGVKLVTLEQLFAESDFITLHLSLTPETHHLLNDEAFSKMKPGVRVVNCARGELIDPEALLRALESSRVAGAALDVFDREPPAESPLLKMDNVIATPHIGGSTAEAQEVVGIKIARQVRDFLKEGVVTNAVNMPSISAEKYGELRPFLELADRLGSFSAQIAGSGVKRVRIVYSGSFQDADAGLIRNAALAGILNSFLSRKANLINAAKLASKRGLSWDEIRRARTHFSDSLGIVLETDAGEQTVEGTVFADGSPRLLNIDGIFVESPLTGHMLFIKNVDVPGVIGKIGTILGDNQVNIADFSLGRRDRQPGSDGPSEAVAVVRIDSPVTQKAQAELLETAAVNVARPVELPG